MAVVSVEERIALIQVIKIGTQDFEAAVLVGVAGLCAAGGLMGGGYVRTSMHVVGVARSSAAQRSRGIGMRDNFHDHHINSFY